MKIEQLIGNTPLVEYTGMSPNPNVKIFGKLEGNNPGGSVKDRAAYGMIKGALDKKNIKRGDKLIEATSGNTGIALAMISAVLGVKITLVMPDSATRERILAMEAYGAKVVLTPAEKTIEYSRLFAAEKVESEGYYMLDQFSNPDNYLQHYKTTAPEIWRDTDGKITHFVSAMGTTGTIMGTSRFLKEKDNSIQIVGIQPMEGSKIPGIRRWTPEFLPKIFEPDRVDRIIDVSENDATQVTRRLAKTEGILAGMSSGGSLQAAIQIANEIDSGIIVHIVCDRGDRYLSSDLFSTEP